LQSIKTTAEGKSVQLNFDFSIGGLKTKDGEEIRGFVVAGENRIFHPATAKIISNSAVEITSNLGIIIESVRYAWSNDPSDSNLVNSLDLPTAPFRTDNWNLVTKDNTLADRPVCIPAVDTDL